MKLERSSPEISSGLDLMFAQLYVAFRLAQFLNNEIESLQHGLFFVFYHNQRNHIEGKFGQGKNAYGLSKIAAKTRKTSESWISGIFFVMNLVKVQQTLMLLWFIWRVFFWLHYFREKFFNKKSDFADNSWITNLNFKFVD
mgnify:CR=1 FL=1